MRSVRHDVEKEWLQMHMQGQETHCPMRTLKDSACAASSKEMLKVTRLKQYASELMQDASFRTESSSSPICMRDAKAKGY